MADDKGEFIVESSAEVTKMLRDRFRSAALFFAVPGLLLVIMGLVMWLYVDVAWYLYGAFFVGAGLLLVYSLMLISVAASVPSLRIYEGGVLLKPPKGKTVFHPWSAFRGYTRKTMGKMETLELHLAKGDPITVSKFIPHFDRIQALVEENVPPMD